MDPVFVLFWVMVALYASFFAGWALKWYRGAGWGVLTALAALASGWVSLLGPRWGTATIFLAAASTGLLWGAHHWRGCQPSICFWTGNHEWNSVHAVDPYSWRVTLNRWGFPSTEQIRFAEFRDELLSRFGGRLSLALNGDIVHGTNYPQHTSGENPPFRMPRHPWGPGGSIEDGRHW